MPKSTACPPPSAAAPRRRPPLPRLLLLLLQLLPLLGAMLLCSLLLNLWTMVLYSEAKTLRPTHPRLSLLLLLAGGWGMKAALRLGICTEECLRGI